MTEFSRIYDFAVPSMLISEQKITATAAEMAALSLRFGIIGIDKFEAQFRIEESAQDQCFKVTGKLSASLTQESVVSLKPVHEEICAPLNIKVRLHSDEDPDEDAMALMNADGSIDDIDDTEHVPSSKVDIGELVSQYLSLSMDPYPKLEGEAADTHMPLDLVEGAKDSHTQV